MVFDCFFAGFRTVFLCFFTDFLFPFAITFNFLARRSDLTKTHENTVFYEVKRVSELARAKRKP